MKYVKHILKGGIFLLVCAMVFGSFGGEASSAPTTRDECLTYVTKTAQCKSSCSGLTQIGTCGDDTSGNILCCDKVYKEGDKCGTNDNGTCREYKGVGKTCANDEAEVGFCSEGATATASLTCCMSPGSVPTDDATCRAQGGTCSRDTGAVNDGCSSGQKIGECKSESSGKQNCCKSSSSSTPPSFGSAALDYTPLENLPGFEGESGDFATYFRSLYLLAIWIVGISALFMLVVGGFLYLSSAGNTSLLGYAKKTIWGALIGLIIALISWLLLDTINSDLTTLKLSGLSGVSSDTGDQGTSGDEGVLPPPGSVESCKKMRTQVSKSQCDDASANLLGLLQCMNQELGGRMTLSSISDSAGFNRCQNSWSRPPCAHSQNSCHYGGKGKYAKSCAADISRSAGNTASDAEFRAAAKKCGARKFDIHGSPVAHIHVSVSGCDCDNGLSAP